MKKFISRIYFFGNLSRERFNYYQEIIRDVEWSAVREYIPSGALFLDVGCGTGYSMKRAMKEKNCIAKGIDPSPYLHGVKMTHSNDRNAPELDIVQGFAEKLPFADASFDVVYSSHVLEHAANEGEMLNEIKRVLKEDGTLIIGMPTASIAIIRLITEYMFTTHQRIYDFIMKKSNSPFSYWQKFVHIFFPISHSEGRGTILYDLFHYRVSNWEKIVSAKFHIQKKLYPAFYPYPDFIQFFKICTLKKRSSSIFFICKK